DGGWGVGANGDLDARAAFDAAVFGVDGADRQGLGAFKDQGVGDGGAKAQLPLQAAGPAVVGVGGVADAVGVAAGGAHAHALAGGNDVAVVGAGDDTDGWQVVDHANADGVGGGSAKGVGGTQGNLVGAQREGGGDDGAGAQGVAVIGPANRCRAQGA